MPLRRAPIRRPHALSIVVFGMATLLLALLVPGDAAGAPPPYTLDERATAIASPAAVFIEIRMTGFLRNRSTGALLDPRTVTVTVRCTGVAVNAAGYVVTTTHCVQPGPDSVLASASVTAATDMVRDGVLAAGQRAPFIQQGMASGEFTGKSAESAPVATVYGQLFVGSAGLTGKPAAAGQVVNAQPPAEGGVALVRLARGGLPVALFGGPAPSAGDNVVQIGYATEDENPEAATYTVQSRAASVVGRASTSPAGQAPPVYQLDGGLPQASEGGPVVGVDGRVLGITAADDTATQGADKLVTDAEAVRDLLLSSGVQNVQSPTDLTFRAGLDAYYAGRYGEAIRNLDAVLAVRPDDPVARNYRQHALDEREFAGTTGSAPGWLPLARVGVGVLMVLAIIAASIVAAGGRARRRRRAKRRVA
jgi:hypothetical protein